MESDSESFRVLFTTAESMFSKSVEKDLYQFLAWYVVSQFLKSLCHILALFTLLNASVLVDN